MLHPGGLPGSGEGVGQVHSRRWKRLGAAAAACGLAAFALMGTLRATGPHVDKAPSVPPGPSVSVASVRAIRHPVHVRRPDGPPRVNTGLKDARGEPLLVSCTSCHATLPPNPANRSTADLDEFHQNVTTRHGTLTCLACHNRNDYDALSLADGQRVEFTEAMVLCAQCHGPQHRDYRHGAHGGMTGYWDLSRGPQRRNTCTDCHHPHRPAFEGMWPAPGPRDRFLPMREDHR